MNLSNVSLESTSAFFVALFLFSAIACGQQKPVDFELDNGLKVSLRPTANAKMCTAVVLFDFGNLCDPPGKSGMAHFAEHLYCTGATETSKARTAEEFFRAYKFGAQAQTGDRYTVFAAMFEADRLDKELVDAADRMKKIQVTDEDLVREIPRLDLELQNMFGGMPALAVVNHNRQLRLPLPHDGVRGGKIDELKKVTRDELQEWLDRFYKPNNARLIVVGPFDVEVMKERTTRLFNDIPQGETPTENQVAAFDATIETREQTIEYTSRMPEQQTHVGLTYAIPYPDSNLFAATLVMAARMQLAMKELAGDNPASFPVQFVPLDGPEFLSVTIQVEDGETPEHAKQKLLEFVSKHTAKPLGKKEAATAKQIYGSFYNLHKYPEQFFLYNVYGWGFMVGRTQQMNLDPAKLNQQLAELDEQDLEAARKIFDPSMAAVTILRPKTK